jgi:hypothetical protein
VYLSSSWLILAQLIQVAIAFHRFGQDPFYKILSKVSGVSTDAVDHACNAEE